MIFLITFITVYCVWTAYVHKNMYSGSSKAWHWLAAFRDGFVALVAAIFLSAEVFFLGSAWNLIMIAILFMTIREFIFWFVLGIGTTSDTDKRLGNGYIRWCLRVIGVFLSFCYIHWYLTYSWAAVRASVYGNFLDLFR